MSAGFGSATRSARQRPQHDGLRNIVRWYKIRESDNALLQSGVIDNVAQDLDYYYPSIAANADGDVVIGFSGSSAARFAGTYAVLGQTDAGGTTTFGTPVMLKPGRAVETFSPRNRFGDYSAVSLDPVDPKVFWVIQEYVRSANNWATQITGFSVENTADDGYENNDVRTAAFDVTGLRNPVEPIERPGETARRRLVCHRCDGDAAA